MCIQHTSKLAFVKRTLSRAAAQRHPKFELPTYAHASPQAKTSPSPADAGRGPSCSSDARMAHQPALVTKWTAKASATKASTKLSHTPRLVQ